MLETRKRSTRFALALLAPLLAVGLAGRALAQDGGEDLRDVVRLRGGKELRGRVHDRYDPEVLVMRIGNQIDEIPRREVDLVVVTVRDQLRKFLGERKEGLTVDQEWALVERAQALGLPAMAELQAWHVLSLDPGHARAHALLGHEEKAGEWRWMLDGKAFRKADFDARIAQWKTRLRLSSEHYDLQTDAGLRRAVDTLFDLEFAYLHWLDAFGETLRASEDVVFRNHRMTFLLFRSKDDDGFKDYLTQEREAFYDPSLQTTTEAGLPNVAYTYYSDEGYRPERLFDLAVQQLMYSTLYLGHRRADAPETSNEHLAHWAELGMGFWLEGQIGGAPGYPRLVPFVQDPNEARLALVRPRRSPLADFQEEITNLTTMGFRFFYGTGEQTPVHRAKARTLVAFMMEANVPMESRGQVTGYSRDGFLGYLRDVYGTPTSMSTSALDEALGGKVERLEAPWKEWTAAQL